MAILKCKMCGGDMEISADKTFGTCEYCGSTMTLPKVGDEQRAAAFNRGNHFRRSGEFDKALAVYERIVAEDDTDAEAHWCCALCRFGIEYVEDPATFEWLPTCHRASFDSFLEDADYLAALENSDGITKRQYQKDAVKIAEVLRGILATSQNAEPCDVFICYKELDKDGNRTRDSILAQDIYYQLTEQGRRVFFSRITLEDVPGTQYEPYIFAALNSAKVMIVVGTSAENLNAVWVKNEWSRYLSMMRKDRTKLLLPCYRDMDPYDLPEKLSVLMSYDIGKTGFIQDLIRGVDKVLDADKKPGTSPVKEGVVVQQAGLNTTATAQIKRGNIALEDGEWQKADGFFEEALNISPECAEAYLGKLLVANRCANLNAYTRKVIEKNEDCSFDTLTACEKESEHIEKAAVENAVPDYLAADEIRKLYVFDRSYKSALANREAQKKQQLEELSGDKLLARVKQYATGELRSNYDAFISAVASALDARIKDARNADEKHIAEIKKAYADHLAEADAKAEKLRLAAEERRENDYLARVADMKKADNIAAYEKAAAALIAMRGYKDSTALAEKCRKEIDRLNEEVHLERSLQAAIQREAAAREAKKRKTITAIAAVVCIAVILVVTKVIIPNNKYNAAVALMDAGQNEEAIAAFEELNGYKDSDDLAAKSGYLHTDALMNDGKYEEAPTSFEAMDGYIDSAEECDEYNISLLKTANVGDTVFFGTYEQDNNTANGQENIEWLVLARKDNRILVISEKALDCQPYNTSVAGVEVTWESCSLRKWMNDSFLNTAFSAEEQALIESSNVSADKNPEFSTNPGNATTDKVFLLSIPETEKYFTTYESLMCAPSAYAKEQGAYTSDFYKTASGEGMCWWWLRSPGVLSDNAAYVVDDGWVDYLGAYVGFDDTCVRPAMWINLGN